MSAIIAVVSIALFISTAITTWQVVDLRQHNAEQEQKIQELSNRVANWEQLSGPRIENLTAAIDSANQTLERFEKAEGRCYSVNQVIWCPIQPDTR